MGPAQMSRLVYGALYFTINALVVRPGAVFFAILLLGMVLAKTGPVGLTESALLWMQDLYRGGPAGAGYLNVQMCADDAGVQAGEPGEQLQAPLPARECTRSEVTTVTIGKVAQEVGRMMVWVYALALIIGNVTGALVSPLRTSKRPKG